MFCFNILNPIFIGTKSELFTERYNTFELVFKRASLVSYSEE